LQEKRDEIRKSSQKKSDTFSSRRNTGRDGPRKERSVNEETE